MPYTDPTFDDFKARYLRDFPFAELTGQNGDATNYSKVTDADLTIAFNQVGSGLNVCLFPSQLTFTQGFLALAAHNLVMNLRASSQGIAGKYDWLTGSKSVGNVSEAYVIPDKVKENPFFSWLSMTPYGAQYYAVISPYLIGNFGWVRGFTWP